MNKSYEEIYHFYPFGQNSPDPSEEILLYCRETGKVKALHIANPGGLVFPRSEKKINKSNLINRMEKEALQEFVSK